jgi:hypothetical protein
MRPELARVGALTIVIFICLAAMEVALISVLVGRLPNDLTVPLAEQFNLLATLWNSNPSAALPLIAQQPVFVVAHSEPVASVQTWGLYYFPLTFLVHLAIALVAALVLRRPPCRQRCWLLLGSGSALLAFAVTFTRLASCCTGGPRWAFEIWLYALAFNPANTLLDGSALFMRMEPFLPYLQFSTAAAGVALLTAAVWRMSARTGSESTSR